MIVQGIYDLGWIFGLNMKEYHLFAGKIERKHTRCRGYGCFVIVSEGSAALWRAVSVCMMS